MVVATKYIAPLMLLTLVALLFVGGPGHYSSRIYRDVWELGHVLLFFIFSYYLLGQVLINLKNNITKVILVFAIVIFFAIFSEFLQYSTNRTPELVDVRRDMVGALIGTVIYYRDDFQKKLIRNSVFVITAIFAVFEFRPLLKTLIDEYDILATGTVLSNLEGVFEDERWKGNSRYVLSSAHVVEGHKSLQVTFNTDAYSGITLKYMHRDWSYSKSLHVSVYYPGEEDFLVNVRINDYPHLVKNRYNDRYNERVSLHSGWNHLVFSVDAIKNAPVSRQSIIKNMQSFGIFVTNLTTPVTIYIDNVYLD